MFEVEDADDGAGDDDTNGQRFYESAVENVIRLDGAEHKMRSRVLAMFPKTTSFYPGKIVTRKKRGPNGETQYGVKFEDDEDDQGRPVNDRTIDATYIVPAPADATE